MPGRRIVITGMSAVTPIGRDLPTLWENLCTGHSGISPIESFDVSKFRSRIGGEIKDFDPKPHLNYKDRKRIDRFAQFALVAASNALEDSGIFMEEEDPYRCGVILGSGIGGVHELDIIYQKIKHDPSKLSPHMIPRLIINSAGGHISIRFGLKGPNSAIATACSSASNAIGDAFQAIRRGAADIMITGGSEAAITPLCMGGFCAMRALSQRNDSPTEASRPFSKDRDGFVLSEGAGLLVFEEYEHARSRDAKIYAEVLGFGSTSDGIHIAAPDPQGRGAAWAMRSALKDAGLDYDQIGYVNAHGTGTSLGDKAETLAMKLVFCEHVRKLMISSTKSQIGHMLGASGGVELVFTTMALYHGVLPPTINLHEPDPECDLDYIPNEARESPIRYAMSNSFGFGGHNASLVLGALDGEPMRAREAA